MTTHSPIRLLIRWDEQGGFSIFRVRGRGIWARTWKSHIDRYGHRIPLANLFRLDREGVPAPGAAPGRPSAPARSPLAPSPRPGPSAAPSPAPDPFRDPFTGEPWRE